MSFNAFAINESDSLPTIYLFSGQGSDYRIFGKFDSDDPYKLVYINYPVPGKDACMQSYAQTLLNQIDTSKECILIGVSLGGMLASEISEMIDPVSTIIVSSAKSRHELPLRYKIFEYIPVYKIIPPVLFKIGALIVQPLFEPDRINDKETFSAMLKAKNPKFLKRSVGMIVNWDRRCNTNTIIHIHGDMDNTLPVKRIKADYIVPSGSHMMILTRAEEVNRIINSVLMSIKE